MLAGLLCNPCQQIFGGELDFDLKIRGFRHHTSSASFRNALQLPCSICSLFWEERTASGAALPTAVILYVLNLDHVEGRELRFDWGSNKVDLNSRPEHMSVLCIVPEHAVKHIECPKIITGPTSSNEALSFLVDKYQNCQHHHELCRNPGPNSGWLPTRVIEVGSAGDAFVRLVETATNSRNGLYFSLSHCWGQSQPFMLTQNTLRELLEGLHIKRLPQTFQDAINVTRKFGVGYLWIDSLCVFQGDIEDWSEQASTMRDVYSRAVCNIAASASADSNGGLFFDRGSASPRRVHLEVKWKPSDSVRDNAGKMILSPPGTYICERYYDWGKNVEAGNLNKRAWVSQERYLSRRTMHFGSKQLFWECLENKASEMHPIEQPLWSLPNWFDSPMLLKHSILTSGNKTSNLEIARTSEPDFYFEWGIFRIAYTMAKLTKYEDKLVAISGIADDVGAYLGDELVAGLWKSCLVQELCWFKNVQLYRGEVWLPKPRKWRAPTWSWASSEGTIWVSTTFKFHRNCEGMKILAEVEALDLEKKRSGELAAGTMRLKCKPIGVRLFLLEYENLCNFRGTFSFGGESETSPVNGYYSGNLTVRLDNPGWKEGSSRNLHLIIIQFCLHHAPTENEKDRSSQDIYKDDTGLEGLVIHQCDEEKQFFERIGQFQAYTDVIIRLLQHHENKETQAITLV